MAADEMEVTINRARENTHQSCSVVKHLNNFRYGRVGLLVADHEMHAGAQLDATGCVANVRVRQAVFVRPVIVDPKIPTHEYILGPLRVRDRRIEAHVEPVKSRFLDVRQYHVVVRSCERRKQRESPSSQPTPVESRT
jgi:hypothetical protein